jgi:hypothetical protein
MALLKSSFLNHAGYRTTKVTSFAWQSQQILQELEPEEERLEEDQDLSFL